MSRVAATRVPARGRALRAPVRVLGPAAALIAALIAAPALLTLLTACGIKPTGVVESGAAARVAVAAPRGAPMAYFVDPDGRLVPTPVLPASPAPAPSASAPAPSASASVSAPPTPATRGVLHLLLGPGPAQSHAGLGTRLPELEAGDLGGVDVSRVGSDRIQVRLPFDVAPLDPLARSQLLCTALSSLDARYEAVLRGTDTDLDAARCDVRF
ncbi:hypothetical protein [Streptomyces sp. RerS4]|uniref:hypothetical protein n=1 Tax=Streptomyces sp. RerS4 TaxID=2942449 RepID=UPI00201C0288|nr:hypothetical protein [Streptomyces sp. RerS4]UQX03758.1 hypothetical protein M4D82_27125 [Streptomyces sp. RerS4]